ncbi:hypothetical protein [Alienimonas sp. DA493]|uniref:hypothetical protein n=1 Tax=Alienimonas sp. DA493 TaxID=3373605 RepID=UPI00375537A9
MARDTSRGFGMGVGLVLGLLAVAGVALAILCGGCILAGSGTAAVFGDAYQKAQQDIEQKRLEREQREQADPVRE